MSNDSHRPFVADLGGQFAVINNDPISVFDRGDRISTQIGIHRIDHAVLTRQLHCIADIFEHKGVVLKCWNDTDLFPVNTDWEMQRRGRGAQIDHEPFLSTRRLAEQHDGYEDEKRSQNARPKRPPALPLP